MVNWNNLNITRREYLASLGAAGTAALGTDAVDDGDNMYTRVANMVPDIDVDINISVGEENRESDGESKNVDTAKADSESWFESYGVNDFIEGVNNQGSASVSATNDFFQTAYSDAGNTVNRADIDGERFVVNDISTNLYDTAPGLDYSPEFGRKLDVLDEKGKLENLVDGYIEQEL